MPVKRTHGDASGAPKRTRFASPAAEAGPSKRTERDRSHTSLERDDENQFLDADITETSRKERSREKRQLKDTDGYGSDSSNDEESVVPSRRPKAAGEDEDIDMFGDEEDKPAEVAEGKKKDKEFMDINDVEGQEFSKKPAEDSDSEAEEVVTGLDGAMAAEVTPFNMKKEMEDGRFTADGEAYVENTADPGDKHDVWLSDMDKEAIKKARRAHRERERVEREREAREAELASGSGSEAREHGLLRSAVALMERGETVLEALQRLGTEAEKERHKADGGKKKSWIERQRERKAAEGDKESPFGKMTDIVSGLQASGQLDVYALSREAIQRMLPREPEPEAPKAPPPDLRQFQYRFSMAYVRNLPEAQRPIEREVFGPFSATQLKQWKSTGFFGPNCENIEVRTFKPNEEGQWGLWDAVVGA